jgi:acyl carrier protein
MIERDKGMAVIYTAVADCLDIDEADITDQSRLTTDLGADSLDFVDLLFTLEKKFGIKIREGELNFLTRLDLSDPAIMKDGYITDTTIRRLSEWLPELLETDDPSRIAPAQLFSVITLDTLWRMVARRLETLEKEASP